ncbi:MAG: CNT family concentrative nucleoside transporter [Planctomycetota bacterium]
MAWILPKDRYSSLVSSFRANHPLPMAIPRAILGLAFFVFVSWCLSSRRDKFPLRVVLCGIGLQIVLAFICLKTTAGAWFFGNVADFVGKLISMTEPGTNLVFGGLNGFGEWGYAFAFASSGLTLIIFFSALMSILYHIGVMQVLIHGLARVMSVLMGVSGAESMAMAANVFVGQTEAPLVVKPYVPKMTKSELNAMMTGGFATIAGSVLAVYMGILGDEIGPHLLTASVMSAPAAFLIAKIMLPETEVSPTGAKVKLKVERTASNVIEAAAIGTSDGVKLWLNVIAMLIAFMGLVALCDWPLESIGNQMGLEGGLSLQRIFGWAFAPVAWFMGVESWAECQAMGSLLGTKIAVNEFVAFETLKDLLAPADGVSALGPKSAAMAAYALCGFANFASVGIQIGGISPLAPERRGEISALALRAMLGGAFASWMTATVAGAFL